MGAIEMKIWWPQDVRASRCDMWLDRRVVVLAFMRRARDAWSSALTTRSSVVTR